LSKSGLEGGKELAQLIKDKVLPKMLGMFQGFVLLVFPVLVSSTVSSTVDPKSRVCVIQLMRLNVLDMCVVVV
jgi:hypothetical protein